jgi:hypothetical protein
MVRVGEDVIGRLDIVPALLVAHRYFRDHLLGTATAQEHRWLIPAR